MGFAHFEVEEDADLVDLPRSLEAGTGIIEAGTGTEKNLLGRLRFDEMAGAHSAVIFAHADRVIRPVAAAILNEHRPD